MRKLALILLVVYLPLNAQELGFGCLGLVGGFVGYEVQYYEPDGLNEYVKSFNTYYADSLSGQLGNFRQLRGFRLGINFFRKDFTGLLVTVKGYYNNLTEKNKTTRKMADNTKSIFETQLKMYQIGIGADVGIPITAQINWKVIDAAFFYYNIEFTTQNNSSRGILKSEKYTPVEKTFAYSLGTGFILALIQNYITLEGSVSFVNYSLSKIKQDDGSYLRVFDTNLPVGQNILKRGGINLLIQLNLNLPG